MRYQSNQNSEKSVIAVTIPDVPKETHDRVLAYRKKLMKRSGEFITIRNAYREYLKNSKAPAV